MAFLARWLRQSRHAVAASAVYCLIAAAYTSPLLVRARDRIASDPYDPILNTSILWWNATVVPFTAAWWSPPFFFPSQNVAAFTESLAGVGLISTPIFWLTGNPILTYNLTFFLTWPLSALSAYLLVYVLFRRRDAAFVAGLAFGFAPYRLTQIGHLQVLSSYWLPVALLALHGYLEDRRRRWLVLFGAAWILQSLSNGYFMLFGGVLIALWIAYFCSMRTTRRAAGGIIAAWGVASAPLALVMLEYRAIHAAYGLTRGPEAAIAFSAQPAAWLSVSDLGALWSRFLPVADSELNLFPGFTGILLVALGVAAFLWRPAGTAAPGGRWRRPARMILAVAAGLSLLAAFVSSLLGPWRYEMFGTTIRMSGARRAMLFSILAGLAVLAITPALRRRLRERSVFAFYAMAAAIMAVLACGPEIRRGSEVLMSEAPYRWLMTFVPGFDGLRVPARFWMLGALCLAVAASAALARLVPRHGAWRIGAIGLVCSGVLLDGWPARMPMAPAPALWPAVEPAGVPRALIELPLGPEWDAAATFRSIGHRRPVANGVSGYDPPHYELLRDGLAARDPAVLLALASFSPLDIVVDGLQDSGGGLERYVESVQGAVVVARDGPRTLYRLPAQEPAVFGAALPVASVERGADGSLVADLGAVRRIGGFVQSIGRDYRSYPRHLAIEASVDGQSWTTVWTGQTIGPMIQGLDRSSADLTVRIRFPDTASRYLRLRSTGNEPFATSIPSSIDVLEARGTAKR